MFNFKPRAHVVCSGDLVYRIERTYDWRFWEEGCPHYTSPALACACTVTSNGSCFFLYRLQCMTDDVMHDAVEQSLSTGFLSVVRGTMAC